MLKKTFTLPLFLLSLWLIADQAAWAQSAPEGFNAGPDIITGDMGAIGGLQQFGSNGSQVGLGISTTSCNAGNVPVNFFAMPQTNHPVIPHNLYRMSGGAGNNERFEQIGQSWVKHAFGADQADSCFTCQPGGDFNHLGVGCADTYSSDQNADYNLLGSRAWINPFTGVFSSNARVHTGHVHTGTSHRILVEGSDLNTTLNPGATYYAEVQYISSDEYAWCQTHPGQCNMYNNASHRQYSVSGTTSFTFSPVGVTLRMSAAINAWTGATINPIEPEPGVDGRAFIAYKVTGPVAGIYHYEYALYNENLDRAIQSFSVPLGCEITLSNLGFHAPLNEPGSANDGTLGNAGFSNVAWTSNQTTGAVSWSTETFAQNQNANAIRWGTLYNFRFDSDRSPIATNATIGFFKTGAPVTVAILGPNACEVPPAGGNGKIVFQSTRTGNYDLFVVDADGANPINITNEPFLDYYAAWSPDGTKIAFSSDRDGNIEIYVMNADGSNPVRLTTDPADDLVPRWSPGGTKLTFYSNRDGNYEIYVMSADGSNQTRLTNTQADENDPAWSPDGQKIVFTSFRDGNSEIYLMDADGSNQTNLTNRSGPDSQPAWSPDGAKIAFSSSRDGGGIFVMNRDGTNVIQLTTFGPPFIDGGAVWSPDGTKIAFHRTISGNADVMVMNADGSNQVSITNDPAIDVRPDWQRIALLPIPTPTPTPPSPTPTATATATPPTTPTPTPSTTPPPPPTPSPTPISAARALNLSTRMNVQTGDNIGIGGFIITGSGPKHVLIRALGPSLILGLPSAHAKLQDPVLELHGPGAFVTITNDNWRDDPTQEALIIATGIPPTNDLESAIDARLYPGSYTALISGKNNTQGVGLIEVYDLDQEASSKLADISTRAFVSTLSNGDGVVIAGFIIGGGSGNGRVIVRGLGPSLTGSDVPNALANPTLELRDQNGELQMANNDWQDDAVQAGEINEAGLAPSDPLESGIAATLPPGPYTALLDGVNNGSGVGLVEVYDLGAP